MLQLLRDIEEHNKASLAERRSMAEHLQELHDWLVRDQQDRHASFRGLAERIQHLYSALLPSMNERIQQLHSALSEANSNIIAPPPPFRKYLHMNYISTHAWLHT
ncbi:uncharacterized protein EI90DRAFT_3062615 [Cantharellus anzutake]|uniref:uncharacterized protein n=1 Tax=Cantharellus anzutake TaxID=1750568 RepID=UPI001902FFE6|nr:uncharacterized protein EI90DRAFT_3062615 [Cantharellus anzutake]KAF8329438.1 hypothetical protein EI90DRAFT_3062615 [Cantharellus anzutake]